MTGDESMATEKIMSCSKFDLKKNGNGSGISGNRMEVCLEEYMTLRVTHFSV